MVMTPHLKNDDGGAHRDRMCSGIGLPQPQSRIAAASAPNGSVKVTHTKNTICRWARESAAALRLGRLGPGPTSQF